MVAPEPPEYDLGIDDVPTGTDMVVVGRESGQSADRDGESADRDGRAEADLSPEEIARREQERIIRGGDWTQIYGISMSEVDDFLAERSPSAAPDPVASNTWFHKGGVPWYEAPIPRRLHRCKPHSVKRTGANFEVIERCRCGGSRTTEMGVTGEWQDRNSRVDEVETGKAAAKDAASRRE